MTDLQAATAPSPPRWSLPNSLVPSVGRKLTLGLGLIGIGKPWGHINDSVPDETSVRQLLETAFSLGIRYFDTAPSYGVSEQRFSSFLCSLTPTQRASLTIATKFGEHWDAARQQPFVDHSYDALFRSLDESLQRLGKIDILQLHKTTAAALRSSDLHRAFQHAQSLGVRNLGASVSDLESASVALDLQSLSVLQLPLNPSSLQFHEVGRQATSAGVLVVTNRPFAMGSLLYAEQPITRHAAFNFLKRSAFDGVVLTGTKSVEHLNENWTAFHQAVLCEPTV
jgi:aryl-alcohol dehydrogenase-like predicted oxidoreductase